MNTKDEDVARLLAESLEAVVDLQLVKAESMFKMIDDLISNLRSFNKKSKHDIWTSLFLKLLKLYGNESHIEMALDLADPMNNNSCQRLSANIFTVLIEKALSFEGQVISFFKRLSRVTHFELRVVAVESFTVLASNLVNRLWLLDEIARLLEDEYWEVQLATIKQLYPCL